jgi:hypothetical protein
MNRGSDSILSVYSDARAEYTKQLCVFLVPAYFQFFIELLEKAKESMIQEPRRALWQFQNYLNDIHDWNMEKVNHEIHNIHTNSGCDYLEDLLTAVFIAHTKVLTAIRLSSHKKKIEINVPKVEHFLFKVLCETSKLLWSSSYLFRDGISAIEKQQNYRSIEQIINEGILQAIRSLVPVKSILKDFVNNDALDHAEEESDSEDEIESKPIKEHIPEPVTLPEAISTPLPLTSTISEHSSNDTIHQDNSEHQENQENQENQEKDSALEDMYETESEKNESIIKEEIMMDQEKENHTELSNDIPQTIVIDDKPGVTFGEFNSVFDSNHPEKSDMIYQPSSSDDDVPDLEILDESGIPLAEGTDFDELDKKQESLEEISELDYEELSAE